MKLLNCGRKEVIGGWNGTFEMEWPFIGIGTVQVIQPFLFLSQQVELVQGVVNVPPSQVLGSDQL